MLYVVYLHKGVHESYTILYTAYFILTLVSEAGFGLTLLLQDDARQSN